MSQTKRRIGNLLLALCMVFAMLPTVAFADGANVDISDKTITAIKNAIEGALASNDTVTVTGSKTGVVETLNLTIPAGTTVVWQAEYKTNLGGSFDLIELRNTGTFEVTSGGEVYHPVDDAIYSFGCKVIVSGTGSVRSMSNYAIRASGDVTVSDDAIVRSSDSSAIYASGSSSTVLVNGGTVEAGASLSAISVPFGNVMVESGTVKNTGAGNAIASQSGNVTVSGGVVRATTGYAISATGDGAAVNVSGGAVFAYGSDADSSVISSKETWNVNDEGIVIAWDKPVGDTHTYTAGEPDDISFSDSNDESAIVWAKAGDDSGIAYENGSNTGFLAIEGATVNEPAGGGTVTGSITFGGGSNVFLHANAGDLVENGWAWDAATATLTLASNYIGGHINIMCDPNDTVNLVFTGPLTIAAPAGGYPAIICLGNLNVSGSGTLTLTSPASVLYAIGDLAITSGTVTAVTTGSDRTGIFSELGGITISGDANVSGSGTGEGDSYGIRTQNGPLTFSTTGTVIATGNNYAIYGTATTINSGTVKLNGSVAKPNASTQTVITGGTVTYNEGTPPQITSISPNTGLQSGGTSLTITGTGFVAGATVKIGETPATNVVVTSGAEITCTVPAHPVGTAHVLVETSGGATALTDGFTYTPGGTAPTIDSVMVPKSGAYAAGKDLGFIVNFSEKVTVTGTPHLALTIGSETRYATYVGGSGSGALTFLYTVLSGDADSDGIALSSPIELNGGIIKSAGGIDAGLTFSPPDTSGIFVGSTPIPTYTISGTITGSDTGSGIVAGVSLHDGTDFICGTPTNPDGTYTLMSVPAGTYSIEVNATGYNTGTLGGIVVSNAHVTGQNLTLIKSGGTPATHTVTVTGSYASATGAGSYAKDAIVSIYAGNRSNYTFAGWTSSDVAITSASSQNASFVMPDKAVTVIANWSYSGGGSGGGGTTTPTPSTPPTSANVGADGSVSGTQIAKEADTALATAQGGTATVRTQNAQSITPETLKTLANAAAEAGKKVVLHADTMAGNAVQGRLYVEPTKLTGRTEPLKLGVYTEPARTAATTGLFEKFFDNNIATISLEQQGSFGISLQIAAKVDLSTLDVTALVFYSYDKATNIYTRIQNPAYWVDTNGYLHFTTVLAGDIIISEGPLARIENGGAK